jgi:carbon monoxide dehydrogenase subunit G
MDIASNFELELPPDETYALLVDLDTVAPCMPGATLGAELEDGSRELTATVRLGPMKFVYKGTVRIAEQDAVGRRAVLIGAAKETRGQGQASATVTMTVSADGAGSRVDSVAKMELSGRAAQTGRGIVEDVSRRMIGEMAECLQARASASNGAAASASAGDATPSASPLPAPSESRPIAGGSLFLKVIWDRIRRLLVRRKS